MEKEDKKTKEYCECGIYMSNGDGACAMCGKKMKSIILKQK
tara:strand:- start:186 stop:308 length:123 start_codon:yes stop_codon:yes gene_type:complete